MKKNLATPAAWAERFSEEGGVEIAAEEIARRLRRNGTKGKGSRTWMGDILKGALFSEKEVRKACRDLFRKKEK